MFTIEQFSKSAARVCESAESAWNEKIFTLLEDKFFDLSEKEHDELYPKIEIPPGGIIVGTIEDHSSPKQDARFDMQELMRIVGNLSVSREEDSAVTDVFKNPETLAILARSDRIIARFREHYQDALSQREKKALDTFDAGMKPLKSQADSALTMLCGQKIKDLTARIVSLIKNAWNPQVADDMKYVADAFQALQKIADKCKINSVQTHRVSGILDEIAALHAIANDKAAARILTRPGEAKAILKKYRKLYEQPGLLSPEEVRRIKAWEKRTSDRRALLDIAVCAIDGIKPRGSRKVGPWAETKEIAEEYFTLPFSNREAVHEEERIAMNKARLKEAYDSKGLDMRLQRLDAAFPSLSLEALCLNAVEHAQSRRKNG